MAMYTTDAGAGAITPDDVRDLILLPVREASVAMAAATVVETGATTVRFPRQLDEMSASWTPEGSEITPDDITFDEVECVPSKVAALTAISTELSRDSSPAAAQLVGSSIAQSLSDAVDRAFFSLQPAPAPQGLPSVTAPIEIFTDGTSLDAFARAVSAAANVGATLNTWLMSPDTALRYALLRESDGSARTLLGTDPAQPTRRQVEGLPILTSRHIADDTIYGVPRDRTYIVLREQAELATSTDALFSRDMVSLRGTLRVGFALDTAPGLVKISPAAAPAA